MKVQYFKGEKVYVDDWGKWNTKIYKQKHVIQLLNSILKEADERPDDDSGILFSLINSLDIQCGLKPFFTIDQYKNKIDFDDPAKVRLAKTPHFHSEKQINYAEKLLLVKGGLCDASPVCEK